MTELNSNKKCGFIGIIGRPNVGKSTLLNSILQKKLVITSKKAQTTRHSILGIKTNNNIQSIYVDTPGYRDITKKALHRYLNKSASQTLSDVDILLWVIDATKWNQDDEAVLKLIKHIEKPVILAVNKVDEVHPKEKLLPLLEKLHNKYDFIDVVPVSALKKHNILPLEKVIQNNLPEGKFMYDEDQLTDRGQDFIFSEMVREKLMRFLGQEVPYSAAVQIEKIEDSEKLCKIHALIWVEREGLKAIVIGKNGEGLKRIGREARLDLEEFLEKKVYLEVWVKVKEDWSDSDRMLQQFGYE